MKRTGWLVPLPVCIFYQKKGKRLKNAGWVSKVWTTLVQSCIWQASEESVGITPLPFSLPTSWNLILGVPLSPFYHVPRNLKVQNQHNCAIWHKCHVEDKRKTLTVKEYAYEHPYGGSRESSEDLEIVPQTGKHELGWLGPDVKVPQKPQFSTPLCQQHWPLNSA